MKSTEKGGTIEETTGDLLSQNINQVITYPRPNICLVIFPNGASTVKYNAKPIK